MMAECKVYRNMDVKRVVAFIPEGHKHVRILVEFSDSIIVLQEATVNSILRAYINVSFHPLRKACELILTKLTERKKDYAEYQHIESDRDEDEIIKDVMAICGADSG